MLPAVGPCRRILSLRLSVPELTRFGGIRLNPSLYLTSFLAVSKQDSSILTQEYDPPDTTIRIKYLGILSIQYRIWGPSRWYRARGTKRSAMAATQIA